MDNRRRWLTTLLEEGMRLGVLEPADLLRHMTPSVLATDLPPSMVAKLLQTGLSGGAFSPDVVVSTLGVPALAEHLPFLVLWGCVQQAAELIVREHPLTHGLQAVLTGTASDEPEIEVVAE
jgi:hypothetical protein